MADTDRQVGIYVVAAPAGARWVVAAYSTEDAAAVVAARIARNLQIDLSSVSTEEYEVGRLGDYAPGITGMRLMVAAGGVIG